MPDPITASRKIVDKLHPVVYFDSSVLIDYWITEGMESAEAIGNMPQWRVTPQVDKIISDLLRTEKRISKVVEIRKRLLFEKPKATVVTSELALWELQEWHAEANFKQIAATVVGAIYLQRKGKKEIGDYLKKIYDLWVGEGHYVLGQGSSDAHILVQDTWINLSFAESHGLQGISLVEIRGFNWPPVSDAERFADPLMLAYLQLGAADVMHVLFANHLGCEYFASFDSDFKRAKRFIEESGMKLLTTPEDILAVL